MNLDLRKSRWLVVALYVLAVGLCVCRADDTITLTIPSRGASVPIGRVRITLDLGAPPAGSSINVSVNGGAATLVSLNNVGNPSGDQVTYSQVGATNSVQISYLPLSQLASPSNFCVLGPGKTGAETVSITLGSAPAISTWRLNSYTVEGDAPGTTRNCNQATRRVKTNAATVAIASNPISKGRHPMDVILVLDKSGSMDSVPAGVKLPDGITPETRKKWDILKDSMTQFVATWASLDAGSDQAGDRLGLVFFDTSTTLASGDGGTIFRARGATPPCADFTAAGCTHNWKGVVTDILGHAPGGNTAMGMGIQQGTNPWIADLSPTKNDASVILMSDGIQNTGVQVTGGGGSDVLLVPICGTATNRIADCGIPMQTVSFGVPGSSFEKLLDDIAQQTGTITKIATNSFDTATAFADNLIGALKGNTIALLARKFDAAPVTGASAPQTSFVDKSVQRLVFVLGWQANSGRLDLEITSPSSGGKVVKPTRRTDGANFTVQTMDAPEVGQWSVQVTRVVVGSPALPGVANPAAVAQVPIPYHLSTYANDKSLDYRLAVTNPSPGTGQDLIVTADLGYDTKALTGITGPVTVRIHRPGEGMGNILHDSDVPDNILNAPGGAGDTPDPTQNKIDYLAKNAGLVDKVKPQPLPNVLTLKDDGTGGDAQANDGIYSATFPDTNKPGRYFFETALSWDDPRTGKVLRTETLERTVIVAPDPAGSQIVVTPGATAGIYTVAITPKDKFSNYFGPGLSNLIQVAVANGTVTGPPVDAKQTGTYVYTVNTGSNGAPQVSIKVAGVVLPSASTGMHLPWWVWLLIILFVIIILILLLRKK